MRGYNEKIFYAESHGGSEKLNQLEFHSSRKNTLIKKEVWSLNGSLLVAIEVDGESIEKDTDEEVKQSLFIINDQQKIFLV